MYYVSIHPSFVLARNAHVILRLSIAHITPSTAPYSLSLPCHLSKQASLPPSPPSTRPICLFLDILIPLTKASITSFYQYKTITLSSLQCIMPSFPHSLMDASGHFPLRNTVPLSIPLPM